ncbi:MAG: hypothetical protein GVY06_11130 [Alphaproteobacteria bacterium]|jgi:hypothetical protein|nr:hypothetical protein [Alphaproteobacteria bacterium]
MSNDKETPIVEDTEEARQGERQRGMPTVLLISTIIAAVILIGLFAAFATG